MAQNINLSFLNFNVFKVILDRGDFDMTKSKQDFKVNVNYSCNINEQNKNDFISLFVITIKQPEFPLFNFQIEAAGKFLINGVAPLNIYQNFTEISAPSIVYPYIRAYISNLFIQSGLPQLYIPSINFANKRDALSPHSSIEKV